MNFLLRTCKCHGVGADDLHWGERFWHGADGERQPFAPPGTPPRFAPDAPIVGQEMRLELHLDPAHQRVWGVTTHQCRVRAPRVRDLKLNAVGLEIESVQVNGKDARFENTGEALLITLAAPARRGDTLAVRVAHGVTRPPAGLYFTNPDDAYPHRFRTVWSQGQDEDSRYYFPCLDEPFFKQKSEALLYVPRGWFALSNGDLVAREGRVTATEDLWHYRMELPYSTYLFSIVAGEFVGHRERWGDVEVRWYVQRGREAEGRNAFGKTADILRFLSDFTGVKYPYRQYTQIAVPDFIFGGMENFTVTTQTDLTLHDSRAHLDFSSNDLVAHEAAHSWFGNLVTCRSWAHAWLHESFATYLEGLYLRESEGQAEFDYEMLRNAEAYFAEDGRYRRPLVTQRYQAPIDLFDAHLYPGGAVRLRHLHGLLGEEAFRAVLKHYLEQHRLGVAETVDLARAVQDVVGENYDWWFHQWITSAGYPSLEVMYSWKEQERLAEVLVKQTQPLEDGTTDEKKKPFFRLPTQVAFQVGEKREVFPLRIEGAETKVLFRLSGKPTQVLLDPDFTCPVKKVKFTKSQELLLEQLQHAPNAIARLDAANTLAEKPNATVIAALGRALKRDAFWGVQQRLARALGRIGGHAARDALLDALEVRHPKARRAVVETLGTFKDDALVARALEAKAKKEDASYYVEGELARALGRCRAPHAKTLLQGYLRKASHVEAIRNGAYDGLQELADRETLPLLEPGMRYGAPALARPAALRAAGELGRRYPDLRPRVLELLRGAAEHQGNPAGTFRGKMAAIRALEAMGDLEALPILRRVADREVDGRVVRLARNAADALRKAASKPQEMTTLRSDVDDAVKENKALRDRVEALEQKRNPPKAQGAEGGGSSARARPPATRAAPATPAVRAAATRPSAARASGARPARTVTAPPPAARAPAARTAAARPAAARPSRRRG